MVKVPDLRSGPRTGSWVQSPHLVDCTTLDIEKLESIANFLSNSSQRVAEIPQMSEVV